MEASASWLEAFNQLAKRDKQKPFPSALIYAKASEKERKRKRCKNAVHYVYRITEMIKKAVDDFAQKKKQKCFRTGVTGTYTQG